MIKVVKFGGSSVADAKQFHKVKNIVDSDKTRKFIVVSACGKSNKDDHKVTDLLYLCHAHVKYGVSYDLIFKMIEDKYYQINEQLGLNVDLDKEFSDIKSLIHKDMDIDYLISRGEYLCAKLMAAYLDATFIDAKNVIHFNYDGSFNFQKIEDSIKRLAVNAARVVIPGFYGALPNGKVKVMSRGGSDITGSIIANVINADIYENWTDVSGIMVADPRIVDHPKVIERVTYNELREMSYMGANVLHEEAIFPVKSKNIPIHILNTNDMNAKGTLILDNCDELDKVNEPFTITGITGRKNFSVINIVKSHSSNEVGVLRKALEIVGKYNLSVESVPSGIDSFSIVIETEKVKNCIYELMVDLKESLQLDSIDLMEQISLVAFVGRRMKSLKGFSGKLFGQLGNNDINIRLISQTADEINIIVGVSNDDFEKTINCIYDKFIRGI